AGAAFAHPGQNQGRKEHLGTATGTNDEKPIRHIATPSLCRVAAATGQRDKRGSPRPRATALLVFLDRSYNFLATRLWSLPGATMHDTTELQALLDQLRLGQDAARGALLAQSLDRVQVLARGMFRKETTLRAFDQTDDVVSET